MIAFIIILTVIATISVVGILIYMAKNEMWFKLKQFGMALMATYVLSIITLRSRILDATNAWMYPRDSIVGFANTATEEFELWFVKLTLTVGPSALAGAIAYIIAQYKIHENDGVGIL